MRKEGRSEKLPYKLQILDSNRATDIQGWRLALGPFRHPKPGMAPVLGSFFRSEWHLWEVQGSNFRCKSQISSPFLGFGLSIFGVKIHQSVSLQKTQETPSGSTKNACCLRHSFTKMCFLPKENVPTQNTYFFEISSLLIFALCFFYHLRHGRQKKK